MLMDATLRTPGRFPLHSSVPPCYAYNSESRRIPVCITRIILEGSLLIHHHRICRRAALSAIYYCTTINTICYCCLSTANRSDGNIIISPGRSPTPRKLSPLPPPLHSTASWNANLSSQARRYLSLGLSRPESRYPSSRGRLSAVPVPTSLAIRPRRRLRLGRCGTFRRRGSARKLPRRSNPCGTPRLIL